MASAVTSRQIAIETKVGILKCYGSPYCIDVKSG